MNKARGGTELSTDRIATLPPKLLSRFQIFHSRLREPFDNSRIPIYVLHDLPGDPEVQHLKSGGWQKFRKLVFVSHWQQQMYNTLLGVPFDAGVVLPNAIHRFAPYDKPRGKVNMMYFSTPNRGLALLPDIYTQLRDRYDTDITLTVFSSFGLYGWGERDVPYEHLFTTLKKLPGVTYSGAVSNDRIREELSSSHLLLYPSIWPETSCLCLIEAMAAGLSCVHSSLGALPETALGATYMYDYSENVYTHTERAVNTASDAIDDLHDGMILDPGIINYISDTYDWEARSIQWENTLKSLL